MSKKNDEAMKLAIQVNDRETLKRLILAGANVNIQDLSGSTPLHWAANEGHLECLCELIKAGGCQCSR